MENKKINYYEKYIKYKTKYNKLKMCKIHIGGGKRTENKIIQIDKSNNKNISWRYNLPLVKFAKKNKLVFYDKDNKEINLFTYEIFEQYLVSKWIKPTDIVLELGARYGIVSCTINLLLNKKNKKKHVVVEPDVEVHKYLLKNRNMTNSKFTIFKYPINNEKIKYISNDEFTGLGNYIVKINPLDTSNPSDTSNSSDTLNYENIIKNVSHKEFYNIYKQKFNVLIVDCEGCLCDFLLQNESILEQLEMIIMEIDNENLCDYSIIYKLLTKYNIEEVDDISVKRYNEDDTYKLFKFQQVWLKK
jgi:FkbM family methyltransferase